MRYEISGMPFPALTCYLENGEQILTEGGGMSWMSPNMQMETTTNGGLGKAFGRLLSRDKMFQNRFTCQGGNGLIAFTSSCPGDIKAVEIKPGESVICQKGAFLASTAGVNMSVYLKKNIATGFFGGEGFIMQKFDGEGMLFLEIDGAVKEFDLQAGEKMILSTGHIVMISETCKFDVTAVKGAKNIFFGGEGIFNTVVEGPGKIMVQTMPMSKLAFEISRYLPPANSN